MRSLPALLGACLLLSACVSETGGRRITFDGALQATAPVEDGAITWTDDRTDWTVTLTEATAWLGPLYLWSDTPSVDVGTGASDVVLLHGAGTADQFTAGFLRGEVAHQAFLDLLSPDPVALGLGTGLEGSVLSGEAWLEPVLGQAREPTLRFAGVATHDDHPDPIPFEGEATFNGSWVTDPDRDNPIVRRRMRGLPIDADLTEGGTLSLHVDVRRWFSGVDWSTLPEDAPAEPGEPHPFEPHTRAGRQFYQTHRRVGTTGPWRLEFTP